MYLALNDLHKCDTKKFHVTAGADAITMDFSFLLNSSGMYILMYVHTYVVTYIHRYTLKLCMYVLLHVYNLAHSYS